MAWDSWPRCFSSPNEYDQAGVSLNTFLSLTWASGLQRWALVPMPYCSTSLVLRWSLAMSSQVTLRVAFAVDGAAGSAAAKLAALKDRLPTSRKACTARLSGERAGSDLIIMVAVPSGGFGLHRVERQGAARIRKKSRCCREDFPKRRCFRRAPQALLPREDKPATKAAYGLCPRVSKMVAITSAMRFCVQS